MHVAPPRWTEEQLSTDAAKAIGFFREVRIEEPLEQYLEVFDEFRDVVDDLLEASVDLSRLTDQAVDFLTDSRTLVAVRYLASPAMSADDLQVVAEAESLAPGRLRSDPKMARRVVETVLMALDRHRFPWIGEDREPSQAERNTAVTSTTALIASQRVQTKRRTAAGKTQEREVRDFLVTKGFQEAERISIQTTSGFHPEGWFCRETDFGGRKADLVVRLWDGRILPIECKVSNSSTNSVKRLNNDAAVKGKTWVEKFGTLNVVPAAVLSGVFKVKNLEDAQKSGLAIFWSHNLAALGAFIDSTKNT